MTKKKRKSRGKITTPLVPEDILSSDLIKDDPVNLPTKVKGRNAYLNVNGEKVSRRNFLIFEDYLRGMNTEQLMEKYSLSKDSVYAIQNKKWFHTLFAKFISTARHHLLSGMAQYTKEMVEEWHSVLTGGTDWRLARPKLEAIKLYGQMGTKFGDEIISPMIHAMRDLYVMEEKNITNVQGDQVNIEQLSVHLTGEELYQFALEEVPESLKKKVDEIKAKLDKEAGVEIEGDFEDISEGGEDDVGKNVGEPELD